MVHESTTPNYAVIILTKALYDTLVIYNYPMWIYSQTSWDFHTFDYYEAYRL